MRVLRFKKDKLSLWEVARQDTPHGEALIKVLKAGICATDIEITRGYMEFEGTLGHEFVGVVEECEESPDLIGKRVVGEINAACGNCEYCRRDMQRHCPNRTVLGISGRDGAFAEYLNLPVWNLHELDDSIDDNSAVFVEPLAAAFEILDQIHISPGSQILVIGDGRLAQLIVRVLAMTSCRIEVVGQVESKLVRMKDYLTKAYLNRQPPGVKYPVVIEASGSPRGWETALDAVEPRGTIILKSTYSEGFEFNPAQLVINEITLIGSRCGSFDPVLRALGGGLEVASLIDEEFRLNDFSAAFKAAQEPDKIKIIFNITGD